MEPRKQDAPAVLLVHGLWMNGWAMAALAWWLGRAGFATHRFSYASVRKSLDENARHLIHTASRIDAPQLHFVGHSLGGVVLDCALAQWQPARPGRVVCLGSPFCDSYAARRLARGRLGRHVLGRSMLDWLRHRPDAWTSPLPLGIIAGSRSIGLGRLMAPGLPQPNDGVVTVEETRLPGAADHIVLPTSHSAMLVSPAVARYTIRYLNHGRFESGAAAFDAIDAH